MAMMKMNWATGRMEAVEFPELKRGQILHCWSGMCGFMQKHYHAEFVEYLPLPAASESDFKSLIAFKFAAIRSLFTVGSGYLPSLIKFFSKTADFASALFSCICIAAKVNKSNCIPFIVLISFRLILPKSERSRKRCWSSATRTSSTEKRFLIFFYF